MMTDQMQALDPISSSLLYFIKVTLDDNGAWGWNLRLVGVISAVILIFIKQTFRKAYGIDWFSLVNSAVTGFAAAAIVYLDFFASETLTGIAGTNERYYTCLMSTLERVLIIYTYYFPHRTTPQRPV
jgi:hypothetical protein